MHILYLYEVLADLATWHQFTLDLSQFDTRVMLRTGQVAMPFRQCRKLHAGGRWNTTGLGHGNAVQCIFKSVRLLPS